MSSLNFNTVLTKNYYPKNSLVECTKNPLAERIGDFLLTPAAYLWDGYKVGWLKSYNRRTGESCVAMQIAPRFPAKERKLYKMVLAALAISVLFPITPIGYLVKKWAIASHPNEKLQNKLNKMIANKQKEGLLAIPLEFGKVISTLCKNLKERTEYSKGGNKSTNQRLFLYDVTEVELYSTQLSAAKNAQILENIHLLPNLKEIRPNSYYNTNKVGNEKGYLINHKVIVDILEPKPRKIPAEQFFKELEAAKLTGYEVAQT